ncbi:hypothetical protein [Inhella sp.]|uniref:hypothetical protein n=1 Tax=Inhella sp. TaxID=1921806 RepID=UPI0035ADC003
MTEAAPQLCAACGGLMRFEPGSQRLRCGACRGEQVLDDPGAAALAQALAEQDYAHYLALRAGQEPALAAQAVDCPQCGARCEFPPMVVAMPCAFCAAPLQATQAHAQRQIRPHALLPFQLDDGGARQAFARWVGSRWFAPNALKALVRSPDGGRGVYLPAWTIDAHSHSEYRGERGTHRQLRETRQNAQGQSETVTRTVTDWTPVAGELDLQFDDELIPASASLPAAGAPALAMPALAALRVVDADYQAGFQTEAYALGLEPAFAQAQAHFEARIRSAVEREIGGDEQRIHSLHSQFDAIRFCLILLPAWIYSYRFQGKVWQVVVNGHNGTVAGERPWSAWKIALTVAGVALGAALLWWLGQGGSVA